MPTVIMHALVGAALGAGPPDARVARSRLAGLVAAAVALLAAALRRLRP